MESRPRSDAVHRRKKSKQAAGISQVIRAIQYVHIQCWNLDAWTVVLER
jgi:hypothetical protein